MSSIAPRPIAAIAAGFIVIASVVAMDPSGWFPFGTSKWHGVLVAIIVAVWAVVARTGATPTAVPRWFLRAWLGLLTVLFVAAVFGREPVYAWIGTPERRLGWLTWVLFGACCWVGTRLTSPADRRVVVHISSVALMFVGMYCLVELVAGPPIPVGSVGQRIGGPYGSSAFLGAALCLLVPVSFALAVDRLERRVWRWVGGFATALGLVALVGSGTRAAFVGIGVATLVAGMAALRRSRANPDSDRRTLGVATGAVAVVIFIVAVGLFGLPGADRLEGNARRIVDVTASSRLDEWGVGARIVAAHPVLGVGPEGYRTALADGITADYERAYGRDVTPDRAHNGVLDVAAAGGVVAGALYLVLLTGAAIAAWRRLRRSDDGSPSGSVAAAGIGAAVIAYGAQQMFLFPVSVLDPIFWLFVGMIVATPRSRAPGPSDGRATWPRRLITVVGAVALIGATVSTVLDISADRLAAQASAASDDSAAPSSESAASLADRATRLRPDVLRYYLLQDRSQPMTVSGINAGLATLDEAARVSPLDPVVRRRHAERLLDLAIATGDDDDNAAAIAAWTELATDVNCYRCHLGLGYAYALSGDAERALPAFERAAQLARPGDNEAADAIAALTRSSDS